MSNDPLSVSFDSGFGSLGNAWNVPAAKNGEVKLTGSAGLMEWATGRSAGHGYGTYTVTAKVEGNEPGPAIVLWPGNDKWPGQEIDMVEITPDGSGRQYGTVHWNNNGSDAFKTTMYDGVKSGIFHDYQMIWEPGKITFKVDGQVEGTVTSNVPTDFANGGINNTIGILNNNPDTSITVSDIDFKPLDSGVVAPAPQPSPIQAPTSSDGTLVDWYALAAQATANFEATGQWYL